MVHIHAKIASKLFSVWFSLEELWTLTWDSVFSNRLNLVFSASILRQNLPAHFEQV